MGRGARETNAGHAATPPVSDPRKVAEERQVLEYVLRDACAYANEVTKGRKSHTDEERQGIVVRRVTATRLAAALLRMSEAPGLKEVASDLREVERDDEAYLLGEIELFFKWNVNRAAKRQAALVERVEQYLRLDRYLLSEEARTDKRSVHSLTLARRIESGRQLHIEELRVTEAPGVMTAYVEEPLAVSEVAHFYREGFALKGKLRYLDSKAGRRFNEGGLPDRHAANKELHAPFADLIIVGDNEAAH